MKLFCSILIMLCFAPIAWSQAVAEHAAVAAASSTGVAAASGAGKSIGAVFDSLNKTLKKVDQSGGNSNSAKRQPANTAQASNQSAPVAGITAASVQKSRPVCEAAVGLDREQLINRCGEPSMNTSQLKDSQFVEQYWYDGPHGEVIEIQLCDGKVIMVTPKAPQLAAK